MSVAGELFDGIELVIQAENADEGIGTQLVVEKLIGGVFRVLTVPWSHLIEDQRNQIQLAQRVDGPFCAGWRLIRIVFGITRFLASNKAKVPDVLPDAVFINFNVFPLEILDQDVVFVAHDQIQQHFLNRASNDGVVLIGWGILAGRC
jgi:hypothetical protein